MWSTSQLRRRPLPLRDSISDLLLRFPVRFSRLLSSSLEKPVRFFFFSRPNRSLSIRLLGTTIVLQSLEFATFLLQPAVIYLLEYPPSQVLEFGVDLVCNHCWRTNASYRSHLSTFFFCSAYCLTFFFSFLSFSFLSFPFLSFPIAKYPSILPPTIILLLFLLYTTSLLYRPIKFPQPQLLLPRPCPLLTDPLDQLPSPR